MPFEHLSTLLRSLRFRLTIWNTAVVLLTVVAALVGVREGLRWTLIRETDQLLEEDTLEVALAISEFYPDMDAIHDEMSRKARGHAHRGLFVQLLDHRRHLLWSSPNTPASSRAGRGMGAPSGYRVSQRAIERPGVPRYIVRVGNSLDLVDRDVAKLTRLMALAGAVILMIAPLGGYWLAGRATRPLAQIIRTTARLRPRRMTERLAIRQTGDELDQLSLTINSFLDQIADYLERNREFVANAAHELRSPLAAIQSSVEVALNTDRTTTQYKDLLYDIVDQCSHLGVLVNQLLLLAEGDVGGLQVRREKVSLNRLVAMSCEMFRPAAEERGIALACDEAAAVTVSGDAGRLRQVVNNLIDNSLKFTPPGGQVRVALASDPRAAEALLSVSDTGLGIAADDLPHIFERFYRGDKSRQRGTSEHGNGLGLSICQSIVAAHGGHIAVRAAPGAGAQFTVHLPLVALSDEQSVPPPAPTFSSQVR